MLDRKMRFFTVRLRNCSGWKMCVYMALLRGWTAMRPVRGRHRPAVGESVECACDGGGTRGLWRWAKSRVKPRWAFECRMPDVGCPVRISNARMTGGLA